MRQMFFFSSRQTKYVIEAGLNYLQLLVMGLELIEIHPEKYAERKLNKYFLHFSPIFGPFF